MSLCDKLPAEKVLLNFNKYILGVNRKTTTAAVRGELGCFPLLVTMLPQAAKYWFKISMNENNDLVGSAYLDSLSLKNSWAVQIKLMWTKANLNNVWDCQGSLRTSKPTTKLKQWFQEKFNEQWSLYVQRDDPKSKLRSYKLFKRDFGVENYLLSTKVFAVRNEFCKLRTSAHKLQIELGRHTVPKTPAELRTCKMCSTGMVEDEKHMILDCPFYHKER